MEAQRCGALSAISRINQRTMESVVRFHRLRPRRAAANSRCRVTYSRGHLSAVSISSITRPALRRRFVTALTFYRRPPRGHIALVYEFAIIYEVKSGLA
ncbi:hypothetical protein EVAR_94788_1 [Eumeta japonica]|uniref:Uncharacterized protein n=1 Tax=Eumeta variegata TaxID=151549 RepID=A0A4C1UI08_EUMVA|nr:hypothetical protein EVAR_94788_1 [Eumeta japonica]